MSTARVFEGSAAEAVAFKSAAPCLQGAGRSGCFWQTSADFCSYLQTPKPPAAPASAADPAPGMPPETFRPPTAAILLNF